jgi:putative lipoprotein
MNRVLLLVAVLNWPFALNRWFGADKIKHFLMSALVQSATYSVGRIAGVDRSASQVTGAAAVLSIGVAKEIHDRRAGKPFSIEDLVWDAAGGVAAAALLNGTR